ncbi:hypothetical protein V8C37DRAFT_380080 [Trichoderma ceciliae]
MLFFFFPQLVALRAGLTLLCARDWPKHFLVKRHLIREASGGMNLLLNAFPSPFFSSPLHRVPFSLIRFLGGVFPLSSFRLVCVYPSGFFFSTVLLLSVHSTTSSPQTPKITKKEASPRLIKMKTAFVLSLLSTVVSFAAADVVITPIFEDQIVQRQAGDCFFGVVTPQGCGPRRG